MLIVRIISPALQKAASQPLKSGFSKRKRPPFRGWEIAFCKNICNSLKIQKCMIAPENLCKKLHKCLYVQMKMYKFAPNMV